MARRRRTLRIKPNGIFDTLTATEDPAFESINEIFESMLERICLVTSEGDYLITQNNDKILQEN